MIWYTIDKTRSDKMNDLIIIGAGQQDLVLVYMLQEQV